MSWTTSWSTRGICDKRVLQGRERLPARELVQAAAQQYGMTPQEYCQAMQQEYVWGGGPEIVALCNYWQRPIHVYELSTRENDNLDNESDNGVTSLQPCGLTNVGSSQFVLRRMACFGSPQWDHRGPALHILSADSRFPDLEPGQQLAAGNHFLALFPVEDVYTRRNRAIQDLRLHGIGGRRKLRGGAHREGGHWKSRSSSQHDIFGNRDEYYGDYRDGSSDEGEYDDMDGGDNNSWWWKRLWQRVCTIMD
jgi:OTU-like cysteine protease